MTAATVSDSSLISGAPTPWSRADTASIALVGSVFVLLVAAWRSCVPDMSDTWYHLALANKTLERGGVPLWVDWEFAPYGRPNLYPPLIHIVLACLGAVFGGVVTAGKVLTVTFYPAVLLTTWFAGRRLFGPQIAFVAVVVVLLDMIHLVVVKAYIPSCFTNLLVPLLLVCVVERRAWPGVVLMTLLYYAHLGFPHVVALGLLLFGLVERAYWRLCLKIVAVAFLWWTPWLVHVLRHAEWVEKVFTGGGIPGPLVMKLFSLQLLNPVIIIAGLIGARRLWRERGPVRLVPCMILGMLPILLSYGGRFMMHSLPLWALCAALAMRRLAPPEAPRLRYLLLGLATLLPIPSVGFFGKPTPVPFTGSMALVAQAVSGENGLGGDKGPNERYKADNDQLADWLRRNTRPGEVVHTNTEWIADSIALLANRPTDFGAWWECGTEASKRSNRAWRDDRPSATFVCIKPKEDVGSILRETEPMPGVDQVTEIGRFLVGQRAPHHVVRSGEPLPPDSFRPVPSPGVGAKVETDGDTVRWTNEKGSGKLAAAHAPCDPERVAHGIEITIRSDRTEPLMLVLETPDGEQLRTEIVFPREGEWRRVVVPVAWMTLVGAESPDELARNPRSSFERLYLTWGVRDKDLPPRELEVRDVYYLTETPKRGLHTDGTPRRDRDHRGLGGDPLPRVRKGAGEGPPDKLPLEPAPDGNGGEHVRR